jgi:hypothetical protein
MTSDKHLIPPVLICKMVIVSILLSQGLNETEIDELIRVNYLNSG